MILDSSHGPPTALLTRARVGDEFARDRIVRMLMPLAERVARRLAGPQHPVEDLTQVAGIGLLKALERFDPNRDAAFSTYAFALMTGEVKRHGSEQWMVRIPRSIYDQVPAFQRALARLRIELRREP